jgi:acyl-CoA thioester hydrolase
MRWESSRRAFEVPMVVLPRDIDAQGIASNVLIVGWMQRAAIAHSSALGFSNARFARLGGMFVVRRHEIDYRSSARLGERLTLRTWPSYMRAATAHRKHEVVRADGSRVAHGLNVWAWVDVRTGRPSRMPPEILAAYDPAKFLDPPAAGSAP